jgi:hypothetical protein
LRGEVVEANRPAAALGRGQSEGSAVRHILVSHRVVGAVANGGVTTGPAPASITDDPNSRRDEPGSDHRPLVAAIDLT